MTRSLLLDGWKLNARSIFARTPLKHSAMADWPIHRTMLCRRWSLHSCWAPHASTRSIIFKTELVLAHNGGPSLSATTTASNSTGKTAHNTDDPCPITTVVSVGLQLSSIPMNSSAFASRNFISMARESGHLLPQVRFVALSRMHST